MRVGFAQAFTAFWRGVDNTSDLDAVDLKPGLKSCQMVCSVLYSSR
jgi:hypothetical protein